MNKSLQQLNKKSLLLEAEVARLLKVEMDLRIQSEAAYSVLENIPDNIMRHDLQGRILYVNPQMAKTLRKEPNELIGNIIYEVFPKHLYSTFEAYQIALTDVIETATPREIEVIVPISDTHNQIHNVLLVPEFNTNNGINTVISVGRDITHIKEMEMELRKQESEYRTLAENSPDHIVRYDLKCRIIYFNHLLAKNVSIDPSDLLGKTPTEVLLEFAVCKNSLVDFENKIKDSIEFGHSSEIEIWIASAPGGPRLFEVRIIAEKDGYGKMISILAIWRDITNSRYIENALRQSEAQLKRLAENIPSHISREDKDGRIFYANPGFLAMVQLKESEVIGRFPREIFPPHKFPDGLLAHVAAHKVIATKVPVELELKILSTSLEYEIHRVRLIPEFDVEGNFHSMLIVGDDITKHKVLEESLRKEERKYRTLADNFPYFLVRYDTKFHCVYSNKIFAQTLGVDSEAVLNKHIDEVWTDTNRMNVKEFKRHLHRVVSNKLPENFFVRWVDSNGNHNFWEMYLVPEFDEKGNVSTVLGIGHETNMYKKAITDLNNLNAQLQALTTKRETAREEERKHIAQEIHDDLGQLLSVMHLQTSMIDYNYGSDNQDLHSRLEKLMDLANQGIDTIRNLITQLRPVAFDYGFLYACECLVADFSRNTGIICEFDVKNTGNDSELEPSLEEAKALIAFRVVQEALTNIMRHAEASRVQIDLNYDEHMVQLKIEDNGKGFNVDGDHRENAFGLVGMKERIATLQGELDIVSQLGVGTIIKIQIPMTSVGS